MPLAGHILPEEGTTTMMRFDRFTERAQEAAQRSAEIIQRYGHNQIDTEHILLALIEQPQGRLRKFWKL